MGDSTVNISVEREYLQDSRSLLLRANYRHRSAGVSLRSARRGASSALIRGSSISPVVNYRIITTSNYNHSFYSKISSLQSEYARITVVYLNSLALFVRCGRVALTRRLRAF